MAAASSVANAGTGTAAKTAANFLTARILGVFALLVLLFQL